MRIGIIDNSALCKKHNCLHASQSDCPYCKKEAKDKEEKAKTELKRHYKLAKKMKMLYEKGMTQKEIGNKLGYSQAWVSTLLGGLK